MKEVIYITEKKEPKEKPVFFTHVLSGDDGWQEYEAEPDKTSTIVYLGKCKEDGDMFAETECGYIQIYKGHLNSGKY